MTDEQIIEMARQAHVGSKTWVDIYSDQITVGEVRDFLKAFAKLVARHELEVCATFIEKLNLTGYKELAELIRARGEE